MAIEDLNLEFEEAEVTDKKNSDALDVGVDLSFSASSDSKKKTDDVPVGLSPNDVTGPNIAIPEALKSESSEVKAKTSVKTSNENKSSNKYKNIKSNKVASISDHKKSISSAIKKASEKPMPKNRPMEKQVKSLSGLDDHQFELNTLKAEIADLNKEIQSSKAETELKIAIAEAKSEFTVDFISNAKLLDHQMNQVLQEIHKKVPELKNEVLSAKKHIMDFLDKIHKK